MTGDCHVRFCESRGVRFPPATHQQEEVRTWLDKHPRFHLHFTPTSSSWLNLVERVLSWENPRTGIAGARERRRVG